MTPRPGMPRYPRCWTLVFALGAAASASGQRVSGDVRAAGNGPLLSGVVVSALDSAGRPAGRTLTDEKGRYSMVVPPSARQLRVVRIGYRPAVAPLFVGDAARTSIDFTMERLPAFLETVRVSAVATCSGSGQGRAAFDLWEQARAALLAAIVARESNPALMTTLIYERLMAAGDGLVTQQRLRLTTGQSQRPFVAGRSGVELAADGYTQRVGRDVVYYAPDADVLFDEAFADSHCFGFVIGKGAHVGHVGLTFAPRPGYGRRDRVDVDGVLWVTATQPELVEIEYRYSGVDPAAARAGNGGTIHFRTMKNGVVFVDDWSIAIPVLASITSRAPNGDQTRTSTVTGLSESGGYVLSAQWPDSSRWIGRIGGIRGRVSERSSNAPVSGAAVSLTGMFSATTDLAGSYSFAPLPPGRYELSVLDTAFGQYLRPRHDAREVVVTRSDTLVADFEVAPRLALMDAICKDQSPAKGSSVLLGHIDDGTGAPPKGLRVQTSWVAEFTRTPSPSGDKLNSLERTQSVEVDGGGRFIACGVTRDRPIRLRAMLGRRTVADTALGPQSTPGFLRVVEWKIAPGALGRP